MHAASARRRHNWPPRAPPHSLLAQNKQRGRAHDTKRCRAVLPSLHVDLLPHALALGGLPLHLLAEDLEDGLNKLHLDLVVVDDLALSVELHYYSTAEERYLVDKVLLVDHDLRDFASERPYLVGVRVRVRVRIRVRVGVGVRVRVKVRVRLGLGLGLGLGLPVRGLPVRV
eukprot:scaffold8081_cov65-Phaeocystis_antarctica.AAC.14